MPKVSLWVALLTLAAATAAGAAEPGQFGIQMQALTAVGYSSQGGWFGDVRPGLGFSYQLNPRLSLRPELLVGSSRTGGTFVGTGVLGVYNLRRGGWIPYVAAGAAYMHRDRAAGSGGFAELPPAPGSIGRNTMTLQAGFGVERPLNRKFSLFAEIGTAYTPGERYRWAGDRWERRAGSNADVPYRSSLGVTLNLK